MGEPEDNVGLAMARNQQERKKCGRRFKSDTMLDMYKPWEKEERLRTKTPKKSLVEKQFKESLLASWFIRTFVQYIEYNVSSYKGKSKTK